jgi:glutamate synthase (NADPH/NADH) small chain
MLTKPLEILKNENGAVKGLRCVRLDFADKDGQWKLLPVEGSEFIIEADTVIVSGQYTANNFISKLTEGLTLNKQGFLCLRKDQNITSLPAVFAAGGAARGAIPLIDALADGKKAANDIDIFLQGIEESKK